MSAMGGAPDPQRVQQMLKAAGCSWPAPVYVDSTGSTNADARAMAAEGALDGTCVVAGEQKAGRGRHGREWISDPGAGLWCSTIIRSSTQPTRLPILAALAVVDVAHQMGGMAWRIKWPNDVVDSNGRKVAGILVEGVDSGAAVMGIGLNVERPPREYAHAGSWVGECGVHPDRSQLLAGLLVSLDTRVHQPWESALADYRGLCSSVGAYVHVMLPGGEKFNAVGVEVTDDGHLIVDTGSTSRIIVAGDVLHATITP